MSSYLIRRILLIIPTLFLVSLLVFFIVRLVPGSIVELMAAEMIEESAVEVNPEVIRKMLGLDTPIHIQYVRWITGIITRGDLGKSLWTERPVTEEILTRLPVTFELGAFALIISIIISLPVGFYSAIRQDSAGDYFGRVFAIGMLAVPNFWIATMIIVFPSIWWNWSPPIKLVAFSEDRVGHLIQFLIPAFLMGAAMSATIMRMTRTMALEVLRQDYIRTAWSKGLRERVIVLRHVMKNAMIPVITIIGLRVPVLIGGAVIMEQIFVLPGIGLYVIEAINKRDYTVISGINLFLAVFILLVNLIVDVSYSYLDPRIRNK